MQILPVMSGKASLSQHLFATSSLLFLISMDIECLSTLLQGVNARLQEAALLDYHQPRQLDKRRYGEPNGKGQQS